MRVLPFLAVCLGGLVLATACDPCRKLSKSTSIADKDSAAYCYYDHKQWEAAAMLFEELMAFYANNPRAEYMLFMYAQSKMRNGEFITAAHFFQEFIRRYSASSLVEEATYNIGYSYYLLSNQFELDQQDSYRALEFFSLFKEVYPQSQRAAKVTEMETDLKQRILLKAFKQAKLYLNIEQYRAAVTAFKNFLLEYPDTEHREEANFSIFKAQYLLAENSVAAKQLERYAEAEQYYLKFVDRFPRSQFLQDAENMYVRTQRAIAALRAAPAQNQSTQPNAPEQESVRPN